MTSNLSAWAFQSIGVVFWRDKISHKALSFAADQFTGGGSTKSPRLKGRRTKTVKWFSTSGWEVISVVEVGTGCELS